jgi:exodeoxyribonuclease V gamma subunit
MALTVHRDTRTEVLATKLAESLDQARPQNPLAAQTVVVAHPGLRRWLLGEFAKTKGIAANFAMILPWQWLQRCARVLLGDVGLIDGGWRAEALRWRIYAALPALDAAPIRGYLAGEDAERRRFQLADHLAGVYTQYLIYRPDWISRWEAGAARDEWQAQLWRTLRAAIGAPHRAQRRDALLSALRERGDAEALPLHVFGVSHLPPDVLDALHALSIHRDVHLYFPDPCREYWADLKTPREILKLDPENEGVHYDIGHPLLVSLGRMAQDFFIRLDALGVELGGEDNNDVEPTNLLNALQSSIRECEPAIVERSPTCVDDATLRVHACHTRVRELEVLKDALLGFLADNKEVQHRDIVVMAPDIAAYAPYLRAVFGAPARYIADPAQIPWHLADVGLASAHPLLGAFARVLQLSRSRFKVSEVMDFLDVPALARRFGIDADTRAALEHWLRSAHVAWGLDGAMKEQAGAACVDQNSWAFGFDRLYAGWIAGDDDALVDDIFPVAGIGGGDGEAIGRLHLLLDALSRLREGFSTPRSLSAWRDWLLEQLDELFDAREDDEIAALEALRRALARLGAQADAAGREALPWSVVHEAVRAELDKVSERQAFLLGGVTICGLVPQRSIPFKVVCLIGMNEGEFPRPGGDAGINLMAAQPRRGDRDTRREDRQLFLEALMAARERLHISYIGEGVRDGKARNPAAPVAELLHFLDERFGATAEDAPRPWFIKHPLQPFDARYFDGQDARLFTYDHAFESLPQPGKAPPFLECFAARTAMQEFTLDWLKRYWRDPAKAWLRDEGGISLDALDEDEWPDREPLDAKLDRRDGVEQRLLREALAQGHWELPEAAPNWLARSGALAAGAAGTRAYTLARERAQAVLALARKSLGVNPRAFTQPVEVELGDGLRLTGTIEGLWHTEAGVQLLRVKPSGKAALRELLPFYIDFAALRLCCDAAGTFVEYDKALKSPACSPKLLDSILAQDREQLRSGLRALITAARDGIWLPPYTAWDCMVATPAVREEEMRKRWEGGEFGFPRSERKISAYVALAARDADFLVPDSAAHAGFDDACRLLAGVLDPQRMLLLGDGAKRRRKNA